MFTGLIEEMGKITNISRKGSGMEISVKADKVIQNVKIGDSIAVNGVCLTVTSFNDGTFTADVMYETVKRSGLKRISAGDNVNLEKSLTLNAYLGGHLVMGDVDCEAKIMDITSEGIAKIYEFQLEEGYRNNVKYIVEKGRVTIDGASLTVIDVNDMEGIFSVSLIPHTLKNITLGMKKKGDSVNVETDLLGKYVEKMIRFENVENEEKKSGITVEFLNENGF